jgi:hypothetical protein
VNDDEITALEIVHAWDDGPSYVDDLLRRAYALGPQMHPDDTMERRMQFLRDQDKKATVN